MQKLGIIIATFILLFGQIYANGKVAYAHRVSSTIILDGKLDERDWLETSFVSDFTAKDPIEGAEPSEKIEVRFLYDENYLYVGARIYRQNPEDIQAYVSRRDNMGNSERFIITFDTYNNKQSSYSFAVTATGVRADYYHSTDSEGDRDYNYNPVWQAHSNIDTIGWTAEMAIPFSQLRFSSYDSLAFGLNINVYIPTTREDIYWVMIPKNQSGWSSRFGSLVGIKQIRPTKRIEIVPYISASLEHNPKVSFKNPIIEQWEWNKSVGVDFKMGLGPNLTLDATVNPDFGQVEADPSVVNLSEFEIFYDEKRPFFIEGDRLFKNTNAEYYYSRRIGAPPIYTPASDYVLKPKFSTILSAAKLTGRISRGWSFAGLTAFVDKEDIVFYDTTIQKKAEIQASPYTLYNVIRSLKELDDNGSYIGAIATAVNRQIGADYLKSFYNNAAYTGGIDWNIFISDKTYSFYGNLGFSAITASKERITRLQRSITQNFQRPDAKHLSVDTNLNWLTGFIGRLGFKKIAGEHWLWTSEYYTESPGLNLNDFGKLLHADEHKFYFGITYRENKPNEYLSSYYFNGYTSYGINWGGEKLHHTLGVSCGITSINKHNLTTGFYYTPHHFSDTKTRGGIKIALAPSYNFYANFGSDWSKPWRTGIDIDYSWSLEDYSYYSIYNFYEFNYNRTKISYGITYSNEIDPKIYIQSKENDNPNTYFKRYIFGKIEQKTISASVRFNYAISPDFTLEIYVAPYISNGKYMSFGEALNNKNYTLKVYGKYPQTRIERIGNYYLIVDKNEEFYISSQDFLFTSFRFSSVLRWEFLPGSLIYAVWQVNDSKYDDYRKFSSKNFSDIVSNKAYHSFMIKISYWFSKI